METTEGKLKPLQRAQNHGTVSRPRLLFLVCVAVALGGRSASSSVSVVRREAVGRKWDSHLNTLRQSRVGLRPRDTPQTRRSTERERRRGPRWLESPRETTRLVLADEFLVTDGVGREGRDHARNTFTVLLSVNVQSSFGVRRMYLDHGNRVFFSLAIESSSRKVHCARLAMIGLRATRPGPLRFLHCGRDFCRVCRYTFAIEGFSFSLVIV